MLFNKQQTLILLRERATNIHFFNQADYTDIFALQLAPTLLVHLLAQFSELFAHSLDHHFLKYGQLQLLFFKLRAEAGIANPFLIFPPSISSQGPHLYSHADVTAFYTSHLEE